MRWEGGSGKGGEERERERESAQAHAQVLRQFSLVALRCLMRSLLRFSALSALSPWTLQFFCRVSELKWKEKEARVSHGEWLACLRHSLALLFSPFFFARYVLSFLFVFLFAFICELFALRQAARFVLRAACLLANSSRLVYFLHQVVR
jgi:hypothetical protein